MNMEYLEPALCSDFIFFSVYFMCVFKREKTIEIMLKINKNEKKHSLRKKIEK